MVRDLFIQCTVYDCMFYPVLYNIGKDDMANPVREVKSPRVCQLILKELGVRPGPVDDLFLVKTVSCLAVKGIFNALQVLI